MRYTGKIGTSGNSEAIRLDKNLFRQHPEFKQQAHVLADIIGPGTMLLRVINNEAVEADDDPLICAFLSFMEKDAISHPQNITPVSEKQMDKIADLTAGVEVSDSDCLD